MDGRTALSRAHDHFVDSVSMLLSRDHRFLFVHIQKTGGSSIRAALQRAMPDLSSFRGTHDHAAWARHDLPEFDQLLKAAFVRNPWERLVSWWSMIQDNDEFTNRFWEYVRANGRTFEEFVLRCTDIVDDTDGIKSITFDQMSYIADEHGTIIVDFIGRFETLEADAIRLFSSVGLQAPAMPHNNASAHAHYSTYYSAETRDIVADRHRRDIEAFGYRFETS